MYNFKALSNKRGVFVVKKIFISICTYNREKMLSEALNSIRKANLNLNYLIELLIVDNSSDFNSKVIINEFQKDFPIKIHYINELKKGYASSRNKALRAALKLNVDYISFIDDDEIVDKNWLLELVKSMEKYDADVVSSSVIQIFEKDTPKFIKNNFIFNRKNNKKTGRIRKTAGAGNVLFTTEIMRKSGIYFDEQSNGMMGEDILFFSKVYENGYKIIWCNESIVYEKVPKDRATVDWILNRHWTNGYVKSYHKYLGLNVLKPTFEVIFNILLFGFLLPFSFFCGKSLFFNVLGKFYKKIGEFAGLMIKSPIEYKGVN